MAGAVIEIKYFNTFVLKKTVQQNNLPIWNGSFGIPASEGGYPVVSDALTSEEENWVIEEGRIRGGYNNTSVDYGVKAYLVEDEPNAVIRSNSLIYSGIFNSRTGINNSNVFSVGMDITKSADPINGSIQKLYAEDTNLVIFQERKVSRALIDKDAIYSAEGSSSITSSNLTIGVIQPYAGRWGISKNPESFAAYGYRKYFSDKNNNVILRLSKDGITEISSYGLRDFFRDELGGINGTTNYVRGGYDIYNNQYIISTQQTSTYKTLSFDETINGWTSFYSYEPDQILSLRNKLYTVKGGKIWQHYSTTPNRGNFYGVDHASSVTLVFNPDPTRSKTFKTVNYEGSNGWEVNSFISDSTGLDFVDTVWDTSNDSTQMITSPANIIAPSVWSYLEGEYIINPATGLAVVRADYLATFGTATPPYPRRHVGFDRKENTYVANLVNSSSAAEGEIVFGDAMSGIKGFYTTATFKTDLTTDFGGEKQLFSAASNYVSNNGF